MVEGGLELLGRVTLRGKMVGRVSVGGENVVYAR